MTKTQRPKHYRNHHKAFVRMDGMPDWSVMFYRSFKKAKEYAQACNERSDIPKAKAFKLRTGKQFYEQGKS